MKREGHIMPLSDQIEMFPDVTTKCATSASVFSVTTLQNIWNQPHTQLSWEHVQTRMMFFV